MKRNLIFAALVAASVLAACTKEDVAQSVQSDKIVKTVTLTGTFEQNTQPQGKATLGSVSEGKMPLLWNVGDKVAGYIGTVKMANNSVVADADDGKSSASFNVLFTETEASNATPDKKMLFFYPAGKGDPTISANGVSFTFPENQWAAANGLPVDRNYNKLAAAIAEVGSAADVYDENVESLSFRNAFAIVGFSFDETLTDVKKVTLVGNNGEILNGTYDIASDAKVSLTSNGKTMANLVYDSGASFTPKYKYYMVIAPTTFSKGFNLYLTLADGTQLVKSSPVKEYVFGANTVNDLKVLTKSEFVSPFSIADAWSVDNTNPRNIAMDKDYVYMVGAGATNLKAYSLSDGTETSMSVTGIDVGYFKTSDVKVIYDNGNPVVLVCNMNHGGTNLKVYKYNNTTSNPEVILDVSNPSGARLGDKFSVAGTWQSGKLIFHDYNTMNKAYSFAINGGVVSTVYDTINYGASYGNICAFYQYSASEWMLSGVSTYKMPLFSATFVNTNSTLDLPGALAVHGVRFFRLYGKSYMAYLHVDSGTSSKLKILELASESDLKTALSKAVTIVEKSYTTVGNSGANGDIAVYSDGKTAYVAALATGLGLRVYKIN